MRRKTLLAYMFLFFALGSCDDQLDIEPTLEISTEVALATDQGVKTALIGCYDILSGFALWGGEILVVNELVASSGEQVYVGPFADLQQFHSKNLITNNSDVGWLWQNGYQGINATNNVLSALDVVNDNDRRRVEGEARFIRAAIYFDLINLYAKTWVDGDPSNNLGLPLVTIPTRRIDESSLIPRSSVAEVYALIIADLIIARDQLPSFNNLFATSHAASGLLSRVYLMQEAFDLAEQEASQVINSGDYRLTDEFAQAFNQSSNTLEDVFTILRTPQDNSSAFINFYASNDLGGRGQIAITDQHIIRYDSLDVRRQLFYLDNRGVRYTAKWLPNNSNDGNTNIMRLAELYLTRAECRYRRGDHEGAAQDLNMVRNRVGLPSLQADQIDLEVILNERWMELAFEGHALRDLKRNRKPIGEIPFSGDRLVLPIPEHEMEVNPNMVQNQGY